MRSRRYNQAAHNRWVARLGADHDPTGPDGEHFLDQTVLDVTWSTGCYIGVDHHGRALYVGMVDRSVRNGFAARIASHHIDVLLWHRVWLLPMRPVIGRSAVATWEAMLIASLNPPMNVAHPPVRFDWRADHA